MDTNLFTKITYNLLHNLTKINNHHCDLLTGDGKASAIIQQALHETKEMQKRVLILCVHTKAVNVIRYMYVPTFATP